MFICFGNTFEIRSIQIWADGNSLLIKREFFVYEEVDSDHWNMSVMIIGIGFVKDRIMESSSTLVG